MNPTLQQIQAMLLAQQAALAAAMDDTTEIGKAKAIVMEMQELLHRIDLVQNLLFRQSSQKLDRTLAGIKQANDALTASIQSIDDVNRFLAASGSFLTGVDQAIDIAKMLAA